MEFNIKKWHAMEMGQSKKISHWTYKMGNVLLHKSDKEKNI